MCMAHSRGKYYFVRLSCVCVRARMSKVEMLKCYFYTYFRDSYVLNILEEHAISIQFFYQLF